MAWVVVGLGNPGEEYEDTRHNAGRMAAQFFGKKNGSNAWKFDKKSNSLTMGAHVGKEMIALVLPETYMNKSGAAVSYFVKTVKAAERLIVIYDDLDLPLGKIKVSFNRGSGGHKGLESIARAIKTKKFTRIRVGISPSTAAGNIKKPKGEKEVEKFILTKFKAHEIDDLKKVFKDVSGAIETTIAENPIIAMNTYN